MFCFPYVGGGAWIFRDWPQRSGKELEIVPIELPARDRRLLEEPYSNVAPLVGDLADVLPLEKPFVFFGHSMGALIAFELTRELRRRRRPMPFCLFLSGSCGAHVPRTGPMRHLLSDQELVAELRELGGTPEEVLQDKSMMEFFLPSIRADFSIVETYVYRESEPLDCPVVALHGESDQETSRDDAVAWRQHTSNTFQLHVFPGDHFFLHSGKSAILAVIRDTIASFNTAALQLEASAMKLG